MPALEPLSTTIRIEIPEVVPSLNRLLRMHWAARRRLLKRWEWAVFAEVYRVGGPLAVRFHGKVQVRICRRSRGMLDQDNLAGSAKFVLDALKVSKVIADDSPAHIELTCEQESGPALTTITVTPINPLSQVTGSPHEPPLSLTSPC